MLNTPFSPWPSFSQEEADAASQVILSNKVNYWTGQEGRNFEKEFANSSDCKYAVALGNGTQALDLALIALGVGEGDEVIVTPRTFLASVSSVVTAGAQPVFVDVDRESQNIEASTIKSAITEKTKAVIVVHLAGRPADMDPIMELAQQHDFHVIEDCAQAHGAKYKGRSVGSIGHIGAWSFCQDKIMTTGGEGGMATTNDEALWRKMWSYKDHGKSYEAVYEREHSPGFRWLHESFGTNWRMTEVQAAIGRIQLTRMSDWTNKRKKNAAAIAEVCSEFTCVRTPRVPDYMEHACYKHYCFVEPEYLAEGWTRDRIVNEIVERGVPCMQGSCSEVYLEKAFDGTDFRPNYRLPVAKELGETSLMFLVHPTLTSSEIEMTRAVIKDVLSQAQK
ncbi:DegT/DnrJ/EryC1/StrS aminotransferase family protein [Idiomarina piscisalsi]|uniref:DegT/DnrJ/EryC1/StrS family aminotransferase n=1 Tax=Idiomarina piscisalsi TaxID=1096243 RepID=UPI00137DE4E2|nr:DegT/DnrJ/EryC1/StrS aminotransferase family protein [Idiomarina piscisalsi]MTJ02279.1 DegT/DnrJ/EryC1/StrS aminotransferase family protein [Idiomarina piscisalsi]